MLAPLGEAGPLLAPLQRLVRSGGKGTWTVAHAAALRSVVVGGEWPQARRARAGLCTDPLCQSCRLERGTPAHRHGRCQTLFNQRAECLGERAAVRARQEATDGDSLWERALVPHPGPALPPPSQDDPQWLLPQLPRRFEGASYSDASGHFGRCEWCRRVGWGVHSLSSGTTFGAQLIGPLRYPLQDVPAGELWGACEWLRHADPVPTSTLGFDCMLIQTGIEHGRAWCVASERAYADLWAIFWDRYTAFELEAGAPPQMYWVKAHTTEADVEDGVIEAHDRRGNSEADQLANEGARCHNLDHPAFESFGKAEAALRRLAIWIANASLLAHAEDTLDTSPLPPRAPRRAALSTWWACG